MQSVHTKTMGSHTMCNMTLYQRGQQPILSIRAQLAPTGLLESLQTESCCYRARTHHARFTFLAKCVTHVVYWSMCLAMTVEHRDRPVKEERQALMSGRQQEELRSGLQQQDAIWPKSRQLPEINAIPSVSLSLFNNNSLSSFLLHEPRLPSFFCGPLPALLTMSLYQFVLAGSDSTVPLQALSRPYLYLFETASLCNISVSCCLHLPPPTIPSLTAQ